MPATTRRTVLGLVAGSDDRGARRIITGGPVREPTVYYWTDDHYRSFERISP